MSGMACETASARSWGAPGRAHAKLPHAYSCAPRMACPVVNRSRPKGWRGLAANGSPAMTDASARPMDGPNLKPLPLPPVSTYKPSTPGSGRRAGRQRPPQEPRADGHGEHRQLHASRGREPPCRRPCGENHPGREDIDVSRANAHDALLRHDEACGSGLEPHLPAPRPETRQEAPDAVTGIGEA